MPVLGTVNSTLASVSSDQIVTGTCDTDNSAVALDVDAGESGLQAYSTKSLGGEWSIPVSDEFVITDKIIKAKDTGGVIAGHTYNLDPDLLLCHNGDHLVIYQTDTGHVSSDAAIMSKRSTDNGVTWGAETQVARNPAAGSEPYGYQKSQAIIDPETGRIVVWILHRGAVGTEPMVMGMGVIYSDDHGVTWSEYSNVISEWAGYPSAFPIGSPDTVPDLVPYGHCARTSLGLVMGMYAIYNAMYLIVSKDNGATWAESDTVLIDTYNGSPTINEGHLVQITPDKLVMIARNDDTDVSFFYWKSSNGGATWTARSTAIVFTPETKPVGASPIMCKKIGTEIHSWFTARADGAGRPCKIYTTRVGADAFFADPSIAFRHPEGSYAQNRTTKNGLSVTHYLNTGYAGIAEIPGHKYTSLITYYEQNASGLETDTDIRCYTMTRLV